MRITFCDRCLRFIDSSSLRWHLSKKFSADVTSFTYNCSRKSHRVMPVLGPSCDPQPWNGQLQCQERISTKTTWKWTVMHLPRNAIILEYNGFHDHLASWITHFYTDQCLIVKCSLLWHLFLSGGNCISMRIRNMNSIIIKTISVYFTAVYLIGNRCNSNLIFHKKKFWLLPFVAACILSKFRTAIFLCLL